MFYALFNIFLFFEDNLMEKKLSPKEIRFQKEAAALQKNLEKRKKQQEERQKLKEKTQKQTKNDSQN